MSGREFELPLLGNEQKHRSERLPKLSQYAKAYHDAVDWQEMIARIVNNLPEEVGEVKDDGSTAEAKEGSRNLHDAAALAQSKIDSLLELPVATPPEINEEIARQNVINRAMRFSQSLEVFFYSSVPADVREALAKLQQDFDAKLGKAKEEENLSDRLAAYHVAISDHVKALQKIVKSKTPKDIKAPKIQDLEALLIMQELENNEHRSNPIITKTQFEISGQKLVLVQEDTPLFCLSEEQLALYKKILAKEYEELLADESVDLAWYRKLSPWHQGYIRTKLANWRDECTDAEGRFDEAAFDQKICQGFGHPSANLRKQPGLSNHFKSRNYVIDPLTKKVVHEISSDRSSFPGMELKHVTSDAARLFIIKANLRQALKYWLPQTVQDFCDNFGYIPGEVIPIPFLVSSLYSTIIADSKVITGGDDNTKLVELKRRALTEVAAELNDIELVPVVVNEDGESQKVLASCNIKAIGVNNPVNNLREKVYFNPKKAFYPADELELVKSVADFCGCVKKRDFLSGYRKNISRLEDALGSLDSISDIDPVAKKALKELSEELMAQLRSDLASEVNHQHKEAISALLLTLQNLYDYLSLDKNVYISNEEVAEYDREITRQLTSNMALEIEDVSAPEDSDSAVSGVVEREKQEDDEENPELTKAATLKNLTRAINGVAMGFCKSGADREGNRNLQMAAALVAHGYLARFANLKQEPPANLFEIIFTQIANNAHMDRVREHGCPHSSFCKELTHIAHKWYWKKLLKDELIIRRLLSSLTKPALGVLKTHKTAVMGSGVAAGVAILPVSIIVGLGMLARKLGGLDMSIERKTKDLAARSHNKSMANFLPIGQLVDSGVATLAKEFLKKQMSGALLGLSDKKLEQLFEIFGLSGKLSDNAVKVWVALGDKVLDGVCKLWTCYGENLENAKLLHQILKSYVQELQFSNGPVIPQKLYNLIKNQVADQFAKLDVASVSEMGRRTEFFMATPMSEQMRVFTLMLAKHLEQMPNFRRLDALRNGGRAFWDKMFCLDNLPPRDMRVFIRTWKDKVSAVLAKYYSEYRANRLDHLTIKEAQIGFLLDMMLQRISLKEAVKKLIIESFIPSSMELVNFVKAYSELAGSEPDLGINPDIMKNYLVELIQRLEPPAKLSRESARDHVAGLSTLVAFVANYTYFAINKAQGRTQKPNVFDTITTIAMLSTMLITLVLAVRECCAFRHAKKRAANMLDETAANAFVIHNADGQAYRPGGIISNESSESFEKK